MFERVVEPLTAEELSQYKSMFDQDIKPMPWLKLPLGSYEQLRSIFDWHHDGVSHAKCVDLADFVNRIMGCRYAELGELVDKHGDAVRDYCDDGFSMITAYLRSTRPEIDSGEDEADVASKVAAIDELMAEADAFSYGVYRGMTIPVGDYFKIKERGSWLFKNFVSCSLAPIMYSNGIIESRSLDLNSPEKQIPPNPEPMFADTRRVRISMHIECENVKAIMPGQLSDYTEECEVILDRDTVLIIDEIFEHCAVPNAQMPKCFIRARAVPLSKFNGQPMVV